MAGYINSVERKKTLIRQAKSRPCVDCLAEGKPGDWPWEAMSLDHTGSKQMDFVDSGTRRPKRAASEKRYPCFLLFTVSQIQAELATCEPVCQGHHAVRTRRQNLTRRQKHASQQAQLNGQGTLMETVPVPPQRSVWYDILLRHSPAIWDA